MTTVKAFPSGTFGDSLINEGHHDVSPSKATGFRALGGSDTFGETSTSKRARKVPLGDRPDSPKLGISTRTAPVGLHVRQLKMDMHPVF